MRPDADHICPPVSAQGIAARTISHVASILVASELLAGCCSSVFEGAQAGEGRLVYSNRCGRVRLHNVSVHNRGLDWDHPGNVYWSHKVGCT